MEHIQKKNRKYYHVTRYAAEVSWRIESYSQPFDVKESEDLSNKDFIVRAKEIRANGDVLVIDMKDYKYLVDNGLAKD